MTADADEAIAAAFAVNGGFEMISEYLRRRVGNPVTGASASGVGARNQIVTRPAERPRPARAIVTEWRIPRQRASGAQRVERGRNGAPDANFSTCNVVSITSRTALRRDSHDPFAYPAHVDNTAKGDLTEFGTMVFRQFPPRRIYHPLGQQRQYPFEQLLLRRS